MNLKKNTKRFFFLFCFVFVCFVGKSILQVPDTGTRVLDNTRPFLRSSIESFWITPARSKEHKYHIFRQYWYTRNVPVFTNTGTFQYLGPEVYFFRFVFLFLFLFLFCFCFCFFGRAPPGDRSLALEFAVHNLLLYNYVQGFPHRCDSRGFY